MHAARNSLCAYGIQCLGHAPSGKINLDHMGRLLRPLVTTECNSRNSLHGHLSEPLLSESAFVFEALPQNCPLGTEELSVLCLQDMKQLFVEMRAALK